MSSEEIPAMTSVSAANGGDGEGLDALEGLRELEKLISEAKEFDTKDKISFNGNKMLNDLLDKPIGLKSDATDEPQEDADDEEEVSEEDDIEGDDEEEDEEEDISIQKGIKRTADDIDCEDNEEEDVQHEDNQSSHNDSNIKSKKKTKNPKKEKKEKTKKKKKKKSSNPTLRKNIKTILNESDLDKETQRARKEEEERIQRQKERSHQRLQEIQSQHNQSLNHSNNGFFSQRFAEIPDEVPEVLLSSDEDVKHTPRKQMPFNGHTSGSAEVIDLSSGDDETTATNNGLLDLRSLEYRNSGVNLDYNMVDAYDDNDVSIIDNNTNGYDCENNLEDVNNCGTHTDDSLNTPDGEGRVLVNVAHPPEDPDIYLPPQIARSVKPHQIGGIRFLYDNVIESLERYKKSAGFGCILSHSMGLGKTMQVISFIDVFLNHTDAKHVLCIVPINTLQNWISEFNMWSPEDGTIDKYFKGKTGDEVTYRTFKVFAINEAKCMTTRAKEILKWRNFGGVLLIGYEMYRILTSDNRTKSKKDEDIDPKIMDSINTEVKAAIVDPGPDLVVCDEGHRIKNCNAATSLALKNIKTKRRIVMTGYPLQNRLMEYWCMIDFVRPNYLGLKTEFTNMFERPITNGQCSDSTPYDRQIMKYRAHVLYQLLKGFVQRRSHSVLQKALPVKWEYVLMCRMTPIQKDLMIAFLDTAIKDPDSLGTVKGRISTLTLFAVCCKIWNHPDIVYDITRKGITTDDLDIDFQPKNNSKKLAKTNRRKKPNNELTPKSETDGLLAKANPYSDLMNSLFSTPLRPKNNDGVIDYSWAEDKLRGYAVGLFEHSYKMLLLFEIIRESMALGDRLLVFSQSLMTLDLIERFLQSQDVPKTRMKWAKNDTYYRLDGSTSTHERERYINLFNNTTDAHLFLISTRAGSLGINLIGANRIVIFDASWNPCHDAQAACRIYRYGQPKPCYIYRLVCDNSLEKKIYDRQVNKQGMANRVVDEQNIEATFTWKEINGLLDDLHHIQEPPIQVFTDQQLSKLDDELIRRICVKQNHTITRLPFEHESLLLDRKEQKLSSYEKRMAFGHYNEAKRAKAGNFDLSSSPFAALRTGGGFGGSFPNFGLPYNMSTPSLPSQITPAPQFCFNGGGNSYPDISQPLPPYPPPPRGQSSQQFVNFESIAQHLVQNGNSVKKVRVPNDLSISVGPNTKVSIKKGEEVMVIQTQKGTYLRTNEGNIISIKNPNSAFSAQTLPAFITNPNDSFGIIQPNLGCGGTVHYMSPSHSRVSSTVSHPPEVVQLSDDDDDSRDSKEITCNINSTLDSTQTLSTATEPSFLANGSMDGFNQFMPSEPKEENQSLHSTQHLNEDIYNDFGLNSSQTQLPFDSILESPVNTSSLESESAMETNTPSLFTTTPTTPSSQLNESALNLDAFDLMNT